ncbi:hypothetical protein, partial [Neolewinella marina]|uniref:hypothetical protein n=1 Tax=Neolewinella marina TaxID=438751 RepID=UPI001ADDDAA5
FLQAEKQVSHFFFPARFLKFATAHSRGPQRYVARFRSCNPFEKFLFRKIENQNPSAIAPPRTSACAAGRAG